MDTTLPPRSGHALVTFGDDALVCVGGYDGTQRFDDVWVYSHEMMMFTHLHAQGDTFVGRAGHVMIEDPTVSGSYLVALGYTSDHTLLGDVVRVTPDIDNGTVTFQNNVCDATAPRRWAMGGLIDNARLLCYGGWNDTGALGCVDIFDPLRAIWSKVTMSGAAPKNRRWAASEIVDNKLGKYGGYCLSYCETQLIDSDPGWV
jgi:hypothetical protein